MERWEGSEEDLQGAFLDNYIPPSLPLFCTPTSHLCTTPCSWNNPENKFSDSLDCLVCVCAKGIGAVIMAKALKMVVVFQAQVSLGCV